MRRFDFIGQTLFLAGALLSLPVFGIKEGPVFIALIQFFMGCWQLLSAIITSARADRSPALKKAMALYWIFVTIYAAGFLGLFFAEGNKFFLFWFFSAWLIAVYYYTITCRLAFGAAQSKKSFLDIAN